MTKEDAFKNVISEEFNRKIIEILYEYPCSTEVTIAKRFSKFNQEQTEFVEDMEAVKNFLNGIKKLNYFVRGNNRMIYPTNMFPTGSNHEWMGYIATYEGLNSKKPREIDRFTPEMIFETYSKDWLRTADIVARSGMTPSAVSKQNKKLDDANIIKRSTRKNRLDINYLEGVSRWHERKSEPNVGDDEETSVFVRELRELIGKTAKITPMEKDEVKYYNVKAGRHSVNLCSNPMGRYLSWIE